MATTMNDKQNMKLQSAEILQQALSFQKSGDYASAEILYRKLFKNNDNADAANLLGCLLMNRGNYQGAEEYIKKAIKIKPDVYFFYYHLGLVYSRQNFWNEAIQAFQKALSYNPQHADSLNNLGVALNSIGSFEPAIIILKKALAIQPDHSESLNNIAIAYSMKGDNNKALNYYLKAIERFPEKPECHKNIAGIYRKLHLLKRAEHHLQLALRYSPNYIQALNDYGVILKDQGKNLKAYEAFCKIVELDDDFIEAQSNRLYMLHYLPQQSPESIFNEHTEFGKRITCRNSSLQFANRSKNNRIRIGYVSPDFRNHSVSFFIKPILQNHDPTFFEIFCYANVARPDQVTFSLKSLNVHWRNIYGISNEHVAKQIENDRIDILVDLAGHSSRNRLMVFAQKPAPIQVTYLGYPNTTGIPTIDYRITDSTTDPKKNEHLYTEKLIYIDPCFLCYSPQEDVPLSHLKASCQNIIFGSFNNIGKLNDGVVQVWSKILKNLPGSIIMLKSAGFTDKDTQHLWRKKFNNLGINDHQVLFSGYIPDIKKHLSVCHNVDIALDTFPYNGTTTTFETLWLGIPVITLSGNSHVSRVGHSILKSIGLEELVAHSKDEYVNKVIQLASNKFLLKMFRKQLRNLMKQSVLADGKTFTRQIEYKFQKMMKES
jgi:predicted O-linked N-acetylglucosamine transferase (SPINDLY family)